MTIVFLDPDYRKEPDTSQPFCCRCQKPVDPENALTCKVSGGLYDQVALGGDDLIGRDCAKKIGLIKERDDGHHND